MLDRIDFNDRAEGLLLATAKGRTLDLIAANSGVKRLVKQASDESKTPPIPQVLESDNDLRQRVQYSHGARATAGPIASYRYLALSASGDVKDVLIGSPTPGHVLLTVLSHQGNGTASSQTLQAVVQTTTAEEHRPLCSTINVQSAEITAYQVQASITLLPDADEADTLKRAKDALQGFTDQKHKLGHDIARSHLHAVLHVSGVQSVNLAAPEQDLSVLDTQAAYCAQEHQVVTIGGRNV